MCLAVTCHLQFWQNGRDLLRATAVTQGWNGYRNKSQHRKLTLRRKFSRRSCREFEPATFQSRVQRSNHWAIPLPKYNSIYWQTNLMSDCPQTVMARSNGPTWSCQGCGGPSTAGRLSRHVDSCTETGWEEPSCPSWKTDGWREKIKH